MAAPRRWRASRSRTLQSTAAALLALSPATTTTGFVPPTPANGVLLTSLRTGRPCSSVHRQREGCRENAAGNGRRISSIMLDKAGVGQVLAERQNSHGQRSAGFGTPKDIGTSDGSGRRAPQRASISALRAVNNNNKRDGNVRRGNKPRRQQRQSSNAFDAGSGNGRSYRPRSPPAGAGPVGQGQGGEGRSWRTAGDIPGLVLGVGMLAARHRRELRAEKERRQVLLHAGGVAGNDEEDETSSVFGVGLAGAGLGSRRVASARRNGGGDSGDSETDLRRKWDVREEAEEDEEEELEEGQWVEAEEGEGNAMEDEQATYRRSDTGRRPSLPERRLSTALEVSLDRSVMPEPVSPFLVWGGAVAACLGAVAVLARLPRLLGTASSLLGDTVSQTVEPVYKHSQLPAVVGDISYNARLWAGSLRAWTARRADAWERAFGPEEVRLPANDWSVCTLVERNRVGGSVLRYRFRLEGSPNAVLPLELGQELTLCGLDSYNQVVHGNYVPLSPRKQRGHFDVVVKRDTGDSFDDGLGSTRSDKEFSRYLDKLPIGDEIAVKPGREGLVYSGPYSPITDVVLIATGLGVVPMIQMVNELLPSRDSSVSTASVIWLNEKTEDFALYGELEKAFFRNHRKLDVSCIVERDLFGHQLASNPNVREAAPEFKIGTLAAVAGPEFFSRKVIDFLVHEGYPEEAIVTL